MKIMKYIAILTLIGGLLVRNLSPEISRPISSAKIDIKPEIEMPYTEIASEAAEEEEAEEVKEVSSSELIIEESESKYSDADSAAYYYYLMIPSDIRETFEDSDWIWYVYNVAPLADKYNWNESLAGMTDWSKHEIVIDRRDESKEAILHEFGHWSNHYYHGGIQSVFINAVYEAEWASLYNEFGGARCNFDTVEEFGASAFEYYILEPDRLRTVAPYTYKLMDGFVNGNLGFTNMATNAYVYEPETIAASTDISRTGTCVNTFEGSDIEVQIEILN